MFLIRFIKTMNIFASFPCPSKSAKYLDNQRVNKMITESVQLLSTALTLNGGKGTMKPIRPHKCLTWVRADKSNYLWLFNHYVALCLEYNRRFKRDHARFADRKVLFEGLKFIPGSWGNSKPTAGHVNCTPYKNEPDTHLAYKKVLRDKWLDPQTKNKRKTWARSNI